MILDNLTYGARQKHSSVQGEWNLDNWMIGSTNNCPSFRRIVLDILSHDRQALLLRAEVVDWHTFGPLVIDCIEGGSYVVGLIPRCQAFMQA
jgi:hypothetical protein